MYKNIYIYNKNEALMKKYYTRNKQHPIPALLSPLPFERPKLKTFTTSYKKIAL